jgi:hypothetical protein
MHVTILVTLILITIFYIAPKMAVIELYRKLHWWEAVLYYPIAIISFGGVWILGGMAANSLKPVTGDNLLMFTVMLFIGIFVTAFVKLSTLMSDQAVEKEKKKMDLEG